MTLTQQRKFPGNDAVITDEIPTLTGNTFLGWATEKGGEVVYTSGASYTIDKDVTLYAVWDPQMLTVTFADYDGSVLATVEYPFGAKVEAPADLTPTRESDGEFAYEFAGWDEKLTWYIKKDVTYTATYTSRELTAEEKEQYLAAQATEEITEPTAEGGCGATVALFPALILISAAIIIKRKEN